MRQPHPVWPILLAGIGLVLGGCAGSHVGGGRTKVIDLGPLRIDRIFRSMEGPSERVRFDYSDVDWVTGFRTEVLDIQTGERLSEEFFCHGQLQIDNQTRLLVTATGISEIVFPEGFGLPLRQILSGVPQEKRKVSLFGMVLNNHHPEMDRLTKIRIYIDYLREEDLKEPGAIKRLYKVGLPITVAVSSPGSKGNPESAGEEFHLRGTHSAHWMAPPGKQIQNKIYSHIVPVDSTVHFGVAHLHNFGVYMRLTDLTDGKLLWQTDVVNEPGRAQIAQIPAYRSGTGFPLYKDHEYEIEAMYENLLDQPVDAMASMYLYYHPLGDERISYPDAPP